MRLASNTQEEKSMALELSEGYHEVVQERNDDADYGACTGYKLPNGILIWVYDNHPNMISIHDDS